MSADLVLGPSGSSEELVGFTEGGSPEKNVDLVEKPEPELEFVKKYGDIKVAYINPPKLNPWFTTPYALNYFEDGVLYRTKHERTSGKLELFLDLIYVGIASNIASSAVERSTGLSFLKYFLVFIPPWTVWHDLKEFMNYYFNDDLLQNIYTLWILFLIIIYGNNCEYLDKEHNALLTCVVVYFLARVTTALMLAFYSLYIPQHRMQMRFYSACIIVVSSCWFLILLIHTNWGRCIFAGCFFFLENFVFVVSVHPFFKKYLSKKSSTALNIEHEDERYHAFLIIAIGEFLFSLVAKSPLEMGWNDKLAKGLAVLIIAFVFFNLYAHKDGSKRATHALRRSATTATLFMYTHFPIIASLLIVGDSGADLAKNEELYLPDEERGVLLFFHCGMLIALSAMTLLALLDREEERSDTGVNRYLRIGLRIPFGCIMLGLSWANNHLTLKGIMWIDCMLFIILFFYEMGTMYPIRCDLVHDS